MLRSFYCSYSGFIETMVQNLFKRGWFWFGVVFGTILQEPWEVVKASCVYPFGLKEPFQFYGMNPSSITIEQSHKRPILLIHGNLHNQSAWLGLARELKGANLGPVFTLNLPSGTITGRDFALLGEKIDRIKRLYQKEITIDLIGHSRGGDLAGELGDSVSRAGVNFGKVIKIGVPFSKREIEELKWIHPNFTERIFEITAKHDVLVGKRPSYVPSKCHLEVNTGHLGLLYSPAVYAEIINFLRV